MARRRGLDNTLGSADWSTLVGQLSSGNLVQGVTSGTTKPPGGGTHVYGMNSLTNVVGCAGRYVNQTNFTPMTKGGDIRGAMTRYTSGGHIGFSVFFFAALGGTNVSDHCYMLGLSDGDPSHIELRKGLLSDGLPDELPGGSAKVLRQSVATVALAEWVHLRLEVVLNTSGDVVLNCFQNDLTVNDVTSPIWIAIPGMAQYIDDALGINTGTAPYAGGRAGMAAKTSDVARRVLFDHIEVIRQL